MTAHEHSAAFDALKTTKEALQVNLTSGEYLQILDELLLNASTPWIENTTVFDGFIARVIGWQETHRKRKASFLPRDEFVPFAIYWLCLEDRQEKARLFAHLRLDRALLSVFLTSLLGSMRDYELACTGNLHVAGSLAAETFQLDLLHRTELECGASHSLLPVIRDSAYSLRSYSTFRPIVMEKYHRLCVTTANRDYQTFFHRRVRLSDLLQGYGEAALRAIDKCDAQQGVLTTHIQNWILTARTAFRREVSTNAQHDSLPDSDNESLVLADETISQEDHLEREQSLDRVREIARRVDPEGNARLFLGLQESPVWLRKQFRHQLINALLMRAQQAGDAHVNQSTTTEIISGPEVQRLVRDPGGVRSANPSSGSRGEIPPTRPAVFRRVSFVRGVLSRRRDAATQ